MLQLPGLNNPYQISSIQLRGPGPSRILGLAAPQPMVSVGNGNIIANVNGESVQYTDVASYSYHMRHHGRRRGELCMSISYEDRRWKWRYASVSGNFNERLPDCSIKYSANHLGYRRSARELFTFVLSACGESPDVSEVSDAIYPRCDWQDVPCDVALSDLCELTNCTIILTSQNAIKVVQDSLGSDLQENSLQTHIRTQVRLGAVPDAVAVGCGPTRYQSKLKLRAVGLDVDGYIRPLDQLSYKPSGGWEDQWPGAFPAVDEEYRHLAFRTVWRWYQVYAQASGGLQIPQEPETVASIDQYALTDWLVDTGKDPDQMPRPIPAYIQGKYYPQGDLPSNTEMPAHLPAPFRIVPELNIVEFGYPVWYWADSYLEPELYLTTSYHLKKANGAGYVRHRERRACGHAPVGTADYVVPHPELWKTHVVRYSNDETSVSGVEDNLSEIVPESEAYLFLLERRFSSPMATDISYSGLIDPQLDGKRQQSVFEYGHEVLPTTRIGQGHEHDIWTEDKRKR